MKKVKYTTKQFVELAKKQYGEEFDYSKTYYQTSHVPVNVVCKKHGLFQIKPYSHLQGRKGCRKCRIERSRNDDFVGRASKIHSGKYDYSLVIYERVQDKFKIVCPIHGVFEQTPDNHLRKHGCNMCANKTKGTDRVYHKNFFFGSRKLINGFYYVIQLSGNNEEFLKIGITKLDVKTRYGSKLPYNITLVFEKEMKLFKAFELEQQFLLIQQDLKYIPKILFNGHTECFMNGTQGALINV